MKLKTAFIAALAGVVAVTAAAPVFAAKDPAKKEKRITRMIKRADLDGDGKVSRDEMMRGISTTFAMLDTDGDGQLSTEEVRNAKSVMKAQRKQARAEGQEKVQFVKFPAKRVGKHFERIDANKDGMLSESELTATAERMFKRRDKNNDGYLTLADFQK